MSRYRVTQIEDYEPLVGAEVVERIREKAAKLKGLRVTNFNSTYYGGGVAETISSQTRAAVVLQKSLREGFGLTVAEAMWKGTPVIGGNVGGIRYQIEDGVNGFLVSSIEETAERIVELINNKELRDEMGNKAHETVRRNFLLTRYLEQYS
jgi:glycosyltransferase involved in cell wall biosynthesis